MSANNVEEFLTRVDMAYCYSEYAKIAKDVEELSRALKNEIAMNESLSEALSRK